MEAPIRTILSTDGERFYVTLRGFRRDPSAPDLLRLDFVRVKSFHSPLRVRAVHDDLPFGRAWYGDLLTAFSCWVPNSYLSPSSVYRPPLNPRSEHRQADELRSIAKQGKP